MSPSPSGSTPLLSPISIAGRAGHAFPLHSMLQGFACHARGVELPHSTASLVRARVRSKRVHDVELHAQRDRLVITCSCPGRSLGLPGCKHAWAALLEVDRRGGLDDLRRTRTLLRVEGAPLDPKKDRPPIVDPAAAAVLQAAIAPAKEAARPNKKTKKLLPAKLAQPEKAKAPLKASPRETKKPAPEKPARAKRRA